MDKPPTYNELEALLNKGRQAGLEIFQVAVAASALELENGRSSSGSTSKDSGSEELQEGQTFYSEEQIRAMVGVGGVGVGGRRGRLGRMSVYSIQMHV